MARNWDMGQYFAAPAMIDPTHTGGVPLESDIVLPGDLVDIAYVTVTDDDDDGGALGFTEVDDGFGPFWVWRKK